ncbi:MAG TPA: glycosyltransferase 87 family protein [Chloroflexia bacterium]|nr:glycosyltransferase 87 family protein [Chloroflexia bacterium]
MTRQVETFNPGINNPFRQRPRWSGVVRAGLLAVAAFGLFLYLSFPGVVADFSVREVTTYKGFNGFNQLEKAPDGQPFAWSKSGANLSFANLPRYIPLTVYMDISLDRPPGAPPARLQINEIDDDDNSLVRPLAHITVQPGQSGFHRYTFTVPARPELRAGLNIQLQTNAFRVPGDSRLLGVALRQFGVYSESGRWSNLLWPLPLAPAVLILLLAISGWTLAAGLGLVETASLLFMVALVAGEQVQYLRPYSWWLLAMALGVAGCALGWARFSNARSEKTLARGPFWAMAGIAFTIAFFIVTHEYVFDVSLYKEWITLAGKYGPFDFYNRSDSFNYPPLIAYLFWIYGSITGLFDREASTFGLKALLSLNVLLMGWLLWRQLFAKASVAKNARIVVPVLLMFGLNLATLYNPAVWGQSDAIAAFLLLGTFYLLYQKHYTGGAILLGLSLIFKPQAIFVAPLLALVLLLKAGWRKTLLNLAISLAVCAALALPVFGFSLGQFKDYLFQDQLAGGSGDSKVKAYNFPHLFNYEVDPAGWVAVFGFAVLGLTLLLIAIYLIQRRGEPQVVATGAALAVVTFFTFAIKMHERYLYYALPFLALAAGYAYLRQSKREQRLIGIIWSLYSLIALLELLVSRYTDQTGRIGDNIFNWNGLLANAEGILKTGLSISAIALYGVLLFYFVAISRRNTASQTTGNSQTELAQTQSIPSKPESLAS